MALKEIITIELSTKTLRNWEVHPIKQGLKLDNTSSET